MGRIMIRMVRFKAHGRDGRLSCDWIEAECDASSVLIFLWGNTNDGPVKDARYRIGRSKSGGTGRAWA